MRLKWRTWLALAVVAMPLVGCSWLGSAWPVYGGQRHDAPDANGKAQDAPLAVRVLSMPGEVVKAEWRNPDCANPKNHDEADFCEQRRMADTAGETYWLNWGQFVLGFVAAGVLVWQLVLTRRAVGAAVDAAKSAEAAVEIASLNAERELRAYISCKKVRFDPLRNGGTARAHLTIVNAGQTPAHNLTISTGIHYRNYPENPGGQFLYAGGDRMRMIVGPHIEFTIGAQRTKVGREEVEPAISYDEMVGIISDEKAFYVHVVIRYEDILGKHCEVVQHFMFNKTCLGRGDHLAEVCRYGNEHRYGFSDAPSSPKIVSAPIAPWRRPLVRLGERLVALRP